MKNILFSSSFLLVVLFFSMSYIKAQEVADTFNFGELIVDNSFYNETYQVESIHDSYIFLNIQWDNNLQADRFSLIITDLDFNVTNKIDTIAALKEYGSIAINVINDSENNIVLSKTEYINGTHVYTTYLLDLSSMELSPVDSLIMLSGEELSYIFPFHAVHNDSYKKFGIIKEMHSARVLANCYIEISTDGRINFRHINLKDPIKKPRHHIYIDNLESYFITDNVNDFVVLDDVFRFQYKIPGEIIYQRGDTTSYQTLYTCSCRFQDDKIHVFGRPFYSTSHYAFLHASLPIINEKIQQADENHPLFDVKNFNGITESTLCSQDSKGNIIAVTDDNINIGGSNSIDNLYIQKVNSSYKNEWFIGFNNGSIFLIKDLVVDKNDDVVIVGKYGRSDFTPEVHNFYLKVNTDGLVTATQGILPSGMFVLYPNPTSDNVTINGPAENISNYSVYDIQGKKVNSLSYSEDNKINLEGLGAGTYFIHFSNKNGEIINSSKVIKY